MRRPAALLLAIPMLAGACAGQSASPSVAHHGTATPGSSVGPSASRSPSASADPLAEAANLGELMAEVRGHLIVSRALYEEGDRQGAQAHGSHPLAELQAVLSPAVEAAGGDRSAFDAALSTAASAVQTAADAAALDAIYDGVDATATAAERVIARDAAGTPRYVGSVIALLLDTVGHEYDEAVGADGKIELLLEYQDGWGFVREAERLYATIEADVVAAAPAEAEEIDEAFEALEVALDTPMPSGEVTPVADVERAAALIAHELEETVHALPVAESDAAAEVEAIGELLDQLLAAYEAGRAEEAGEFAAQAYLDHYEVIEADVIEHAPTINAELEPLLGADLRRKIQEGAPVAEIRTMVERAKTLLADALEALEKS
jgi:hypothetical protein